MSFHPLTAHEREPKVLPYHIVMLTSWPKAACASSATPIVLRAVIFPVVCLGGFGQLRTTYKMTMIGLRYNTWTALKKKPALYSDLHDEPRVMTGMLLVITVVRVSVENERMRGA